MKTVEFIAIACGLQDCVCKWLTSDGWFDARQIVPHVFYIPHNLSGSAWLTLSRRNSKNAAKLSVKKDALFADSEAIMVMCDFWVTEVKDLIRKHGPYLTCHYQED